MDEPDYQRSLAEDAARAWWMVELALLDERAEAADIRAAIRLRLLDMDGMNEAICQRIVERCFGRDGDRLDARQRWARPSSGQRAFRGPGLLENTQILCEDLFEMAHGLPRFKADFRLHRLSRVIDPDALVCLDGRVKLPFDERYDWPSIPLGEGGNASGLLQDGSVDSHIHLGGTLPPLFYWVALMGGEIPLDALSIYPTDHTRSSNGKQLWQQAICRAMALRLCLAARVQRYFHGQEGKRVFAHLPLPPPDEDSTGQPWHRRLFAPVQNRPRRDSPPQRERQAAKRLVSRLPRPTLRHVAEQPWFNLEKKLRRGFPTDGLSLRRYPSFAEIRAVALGLSHKQRFSIAPKDRWPLTDPLRQERLAALGGCHYAEGERRLLVYAARLLRESEDTAERAEVEQDLLAYLRIRNALHRKLAHDHGADGLMSFIESFNRRGFYCGQRKSVARVKAAAQKSDAPVRERLLLRRNMRRRMGRLLEHSRMKAALDMQLVEAYAPPPLRAAGPHFAYTACGMVPGSRDAAALPGEWFTLPGPLRRIEMRVSLPEGNQMMRILHVWLEAIAAHLRTDCGIRNHQVGLLFHLIKKSGSRRDVREAEWHAKRLCHLLNGYPGLRRYVVGIDAAGDERRAAPRVFAKAFRQLRRCEQKLRPHPEHPSMRLGWTYHAGEDADDLLTSLRHIDEVARLLLPKASPARLGHALLLGEPPERFYQRHHGEVEVMLGPHLLDLVWAQGRLGEDRHPEHVAWLRHRIVQLASKETRVPRIERCYEAMEMDGDGGEPKTETELLRILHFTFKEDNAHKPLTLFASQDWIEMAGLLQQELRESLTRRRISIEANPTSNLIIGGYSHYRDLPYQTLVEAGLPLSLNTDDPGLFMSSLPAEFASMYKALAETMRHREALVWLRERLFDAQQGSFLGNVPIGADNPLFDIKSLAWLFKFCP